MRRVVDRDSFENEQMFNLFKKVFKNNSSDEELLTSRASHKYFDIRTRCSACDIGIGKSRMLIADRWVEYEHEQKEPIMLHGRKYCKDCYDAVLRRRKKMQS